MDEEGAKSPDNPLPASIEENDHADPLSDACQEGNAEGDSPACPSAGPDTTE